MAEDYSTNLPSKLPETIDPKALMAAKMAEKEAFAAKLKDQMEKTKKQAEGFKKEIVSKFKKQLLGVAVLPPKPNTEKTELLILLDVDGKEIEDKLRKKRELEEKINKIGESKLKGTVINIIILDEIWDACFKSKFDILNIITMGLPIYDSGWLGALRATELHKRLVLDKFEKYVVSYVIGGSMVRGDANEYSDIDTFVVIDDTDVSRMTSAELRQKLMSIIWGMASEASMMAGVKNKLNIQVYVLTDMWDSIKNANPVIFTFLRDGIPLYDRGIFTPWKLLLKKGKITPSPEAVENYRKSGQQFIGRTKRSLREIAIEDFFWATITPSQGALMLAGVPPGAPNEVGVQLKEHFVKTGLLEEKYVKIWENILKIRKDFEHGKTKEIDPKTIVKLLQDAESYLERLDKLFNQIESSQVKKEVTDAYNQAVEDSLAALAMVGVSATEKDLVKKLETDLVKKKLAPSKYVEVLKKIIDIKKTGKASRQEIASLLFEQQRLVVDVFDRIRAEKGKKIEKYKIAGKYGNKTANIWFLTNSAYVIFDISNPQTQIKCYEVDKTGALVRPKTASLKELNNAVKKFVGTPTTITGATIRSLKEILGEDIQLVIGA